MYPNYGIGLTSASTMLWDLGLVGFTLHIAIYIAAWISANRIWKRAADAAIRYDALAVQSAIACFIVFIFYRDSGVNLLALEVVIACVLGYLTFLCRFANENRTDTDQPKPLREKRN
jgi:Ca2+/Na+ antiporter